MDASAVAVKMNHKLERVVSNIRNATLKLQESRLSAEERTKEERRICIESSLAVSDLSTESDIGALKSVLSEAQQSVEDEFVALEVRNRIAELDVQCL